MLKPLKLVMLVGQTLTATALYWRRICLHVKTFHVNIQNHQIVLWIHNIDKHDNEHDKFVSNDVIVE